MAITINGKVYRNIQEQVEKNKDDIKTLQDSDFATKGYVDNSVSGIYGDVYTREQSDARYPTEEHMNYVVNHVLQAEDTDYKTELVFEPDDAYLEYHDKDPQNPEDFRWGLVQKCFEIERLQQIHLYAHNVQLSVKLKNAGVTSDTFTGRVNLTLYLPTREQLTEATLKQRVQMGTRVSATGFAIETDNQYNYTVIALVKLSDMISTDLEVDLVPTNRYAASGLITSIIGEITDFTDKVAAIF